MREEFVMKTVDNVHLSQRISKYSVFFHAKTSVESVFKEGSSGIK